MNEEGQELLDSSRAAVPTHRRLGCRVNQNALAFAAGLGPGHHRSHVWPAKVDDLLYSLCCKKKKHYKHCVFSR